MDKAFCTDIILSVFWAESETVIRMKRMLGLRGKSVKRKIDSDFGESNIINSRVDSFQRDPKIQLSISTEDFNIFTSSLKISSTAYATKPTVKEFVVGDEDVIPKAASTKAVAAFFKLKYRHYVVVA